MEIIYHAVYFVFEDFEVALDGAKSSIHILSVRFCTNQMVSKMLRQLRKDILHFVVLVSHDLSKLLYLFIDIMAQLSCPFCRLCLDFLNGPTHFLG